MGETQVSSEFEYSASFLRILIPGIIFSTSISFLLILNNLQYISIFKELITKSVWDILPIGAVFIIVSIIVGLLISVLIIPLTMVLEGYYLEQYQKSYFVHALKDILQRKQWKKYTKYIENFNSTEDNINKKIIYTNIYNYFSCCLYELNKNPRINEDDLKKCILPTKLGNVFRSMEIYPEWKYGMDGVFFWTRIQLLMSEENKEIIEKTRAFVDLFVELTWIFFIVSIVYLTVLAFNGKYLLSVSFFIILLLFSLASYNMAVQSALKFGYYTRSIFDLYREDLWNKIKNYQFNKLDSLPEKERWDNIFRYLWFYNTIQCQKCGKFFESISEHKCNR